MKILQAILCLSLGICTLKTQAQFKPGTLMLGSTIGTSAYSNANADYSYDNGQAKTTGTNTYTFSLGPQLGVFISARIVLGGTLSCNLSTSHSSTTTTNTNNTQTGSISNSTTTTVSFGPFLRYYFAGVPAKNWFYLQANAAAGTGSGTSSGSSYTTTTIGSTDGKVSDIFTWNAAGSIGMTHFFDKHVGMDIALGYSYAHNHNYNIVQSNTTNKVTGAFSTSSNNYTLNAGTNGMTLGVGFHWFL